MHPLVGIHGKARSGKDTLANFLVSARGGYICSFADPIRAMLLALGIDMHSPYWQEHKEQDIPALGVSPRYLMQTLGTEWGRGLVNPKLWVILAHNRLLKQGPGMVIPDVRFPEEAEWIRSTGGRIIHLNRRDAPSVRDHVSEHGIEVMPEDLMVTNNGTLEDLQSTVMRIVDVNKT